MWKKEIPQAEVKRHLLLFGPDMVCLQLTELPPPSACEREGVVL